MNPTKLIRCAVIGVLPWLFLSGCGKTEQTVKLTPGALVNGQIVAAEQVNAELTKLGQVPPDKSQELANRIMKNLVDQELLAQQAVQSKLDQEPEIQAKIAVARRQILAEAQIAVLTKSDKAPTDAEIKAYFDQHPELFSQRRLYKLQELIVESQPEKMAEVDALAQEAKTPRELAMALQAKGIPVGAREAVKPAEDLPAEWLAKLTQMKVGQSLTQTQGGKMSIVVLAGAENRPVTLAQASPMIARYLANAGKRDRIQAEIDKLRAQAKIEFRAPYADFKGTPVSR